MRLSLGAIVVALLLGAGCGSTDPTGPASASDEAGIASAVPAFTAHFTDPLYNDVSDELTPFGSDEGADLLAQWGDRREELGPGSTVAEVLGGDPKDYLNSHTIEDVQAVQAAGFTLLRLTGHIDAAGKQATLKALEELMSPRLFGPDATLARQRDDLRSWTE